MAKAESFSLQLAWLSLPVNIIIENSVKSRKFRILMVLPKMARWKHYHLYTLKTQRLLVPPFIVDAFTVVANSIDRQIMIHHFKFSLFGNHSLSVLN